MSFVQKEFNGDAEMGQNIVPQKMSLNQPFDIGKWYEEEEEEVCVHNVDVILGNLQTSFDLNRHIDHKQQ